MTDLDLYVTRLLRAVKVADEANTEQLKAGVADYSTYQNLLGVAHTLASLQDRIESEYIKIKKGDVDDTGEGQRVATIN